MARSRTTFCGHPKGLYVLFLTEMWERFSFYGMRALLIYYMTKHLMFGQAKASQIYGLYSGLVYLTPLLGGILADRVWGQRRTVVAGGVLMAIGHFLMAYESAFFPALAFLIVGNGAFKPNISTQVASLYPQGDARRDRAFSIFYVGINLGALFSPLVCGTLADLYGWHYGFVAAGVGMVIGLLIYLKGMHWLGKDAFTAGKSQAAAERVPEVDSQRASAEKGRVLGLAAVCLASVAFWAAYEQQGNTIALWADNNTDRSFFGWEFPAAWVQSLNPAFVFIFTPMISSLWTWQSKRRQEPSAVLKMAIGCFLLAFGFSLMIPAAGWCAAGGHRVSIWWIIVLTLLVTLGELYVSPVGLSLVAKASPTRIVSMMMGIWFLAAFLGNYGAGLLGQYWEKMPKDAFFLVTAVLGFSAGLAILALLRPLKRAMGPEAKCAAAL